MTGDDSYHAHCFKCKVCKSRIDELVFAKTSQGIYCMKCHNDRMIKIRKHAQKKAERAVGGSGSTKSRERDHSNHHRENGVCSPSFASGAIHSISYCNQVSLDIHHSTPKSQSFVHSQPFSSNPPDISAVKLPPAPYVSDAFEPSPRTAASTVTPQVKPLPSLSSFPSSQSISVTVAPPDSDFPSAFGQYPPKSDTHLGNDRSNPVEQNTLPPPHTSICTDDGRRRSYDDGVRPLNILFGRKGEPTQQLSEVPLTAPAVSEGLSVATSRRDKRHSINPGLSLSDLNAIANISALAPTLSPSSPSHLCRQSSTPPTPISSLREQSNPQSPLSRSTSQSGSRLSHSSFQSSSSLPHVEAEQQLPPQSSTLSIHYREQDQTIVVRPSPPSSVILDSVPPPKAPPRMHPLDGQSSPDVDGSKGRDHSSAMDLKETDVVHQLQRGSRSDSSRLSDPSLSKSRSISPAHRADVPHNIESETDTEAESDHGARQFQIRDLAPPAPSSKEHKVDFTETKDADLNVSFPTQLDNGSDDTESSPVEHTSHSTFIAPALPPIRFSMNTADFSELFNSVGGVPSIRSVDHLAKLSEMHENYTPPSTATLELNLTPTSNITVKLVAENGSRSGIEAAGERSFSDDHSIDWYVLW